MKGRTKKKEKQMIERKHILFDTNIFIKAFENFDVFIGLFDYLRKQNCKIVHFPLVEFEFTRNTFLPEHIKARELFIKKIASLSLPMHPTLIDDAMTIARAYAHKRIGKGQIHLVDCCIAAYLMHYKSTLLLLTLNHKDFPVILFDRLSVFPLDDKKSNEVFAPAFYKYNSTKWNELRRGLKNLPVPKV